MIGHLYYFLQFCPLLLHIPHPLFFRDKRPFITHISSSNWSISILKNLINFNWRIIALKYCDFFCHTLTWISHMCTCVPLSWTPFLHQLLYPSSQWVIWREPNDTGTCRNVLQKNAGLEESELLTQYPYYQIFLLLMREIL